MTHKILAMTVLALLAPPLLANPYRFTEQDIQYLQQFSLANLPQPPAAPGNAYADNPKAAALGRQWFFDKRFSANQKLACASCHQPQRYFTDGLPQSEGVAKLRRNAPSILGAAYGPWQYWDGRKDSLWSQALAPLEDPHEQGGSRADMANLIVNNYQTDYEGVFGPIEKPLTQKNSTQIFVNIGKAIMAYERQLRMLPAPLDEFIQALANKADEKQLKNLLSLDQVNGLRLFVGKAGCVSCHNGPLLTNFEFHNVGIPEINSERVDLGRFDGIEQLRRDEFSCLSVWSDANKTQCLEMQFLKAQGPELVGAFKTPSLRNVAMTAPYMHSGQFTTLEQVVTHYNKPTPPVFIRDQHPSRPHFDILPLNLGEQEQRELIGFFNALTSPIPDNNLWWSEPR